MSDETTTTGNTSSRKEEAGRFKAAFDESLRTYLNQCLERYHRRLPHPHLDHIFSHLPSVCAGGKRLRPYIAFALFEASHPGTRFEDLREILLAIELFHIFCLIHDDIMDEASLRHGTATIHHFVSDTLYASTPHGLSSKRAGESQSILVGDLVFNLVMQLLDAAAECPLPHVPAVRRVFHDLIEEVCLGQMLDIDLTVRTQVPETVVILKNEFKTARYSFVRPLQIGATLAGRPELLPVCEAFGLALGQLYQIQDDLLDLFGDPSETKKEALTDITQNQHTVLTAHLRSHGGPGAAFLDSLVGTTPTTDQAHQLREYFIASGAVAHAESLITQHQAAARTALRDPALSPRERLFLSDFIALVHKRRT
jgi:geranylgeranyl diphosphate synthase type I